MTLQRNGTFAKDELSDDTPLQRFQMIDEFPDLIKDSDTDGGGAGKGKQGKKFLSRGLSRLFRRATASGFYNVHSTNLLDASGKSYSESNLNEICLLRASSISESRVQRNEIKFARRVRPSSMYVSTTFSRDAVLTHKEGDIFMQRSSPIRKGPESWVVVHKLKSQSDGGILDPDDKLVDVADDREQIMAIYEEDNDGMPSLQHNAGDGTSASSVGTNSPDIFQGSDHKFQPFARTDIEITGEELSNGIVGSSGASSGGGLTLQVRRGSEPALNRLSPVHLSPPDPSKRWSAAPKIDEDKDVDKNYTEGGEQERVNASVLSENSVVSVSVGENNSSSSRQVSNGAPETCGLFQKHSKYSSSSTTYASGGGGVNAQIQNRSASSSSKYSVSTTDVEKRETGSKFSRDHHRLSMQFVGDSGYKWADAADRALSLSLRKEPLGANAAPETPMENLAPQHFSTPTSEYPPHSQLLNGSVHDSFSSEIQPRRMLDIVLKHEPGPLGIHVVPEHNADARNQGLIVQSVEPGGRIDRDGRVQANDKIIEINEQCLIGVQFQKAQELFRDGLKAAELRLKVLKHSTNFDTSSLHTDLYSEESEKENMIEGQEKIVGDSKVATVSQTKKLPLQQQSTTPPRPGVVTTNLITSNTRKIGRKYEIDLQKGPEGLGFSITTRDNPAGGNCPIYIKNILPTGAAIVDGRLRPGDRLLEVNGIEITGKTQSEAVSILRNIPQGGIVKLVVSRQERVDLSPKLPRQIPPDKLEEDSPPSLWSEREVLTLDIPVLDTEKAGLGISVKGKTNAVRGKMMDMGIFIKSVIHGGAASRDGRLKSNDQLLNINGVSLLNRSNTDAMETLRRTMTQDGGPKPKPGFITLTIARRVPSSSAPTTDLSGGGSSASGDETDSWSKNASMSVDGSRTEDKSVTIESLNRSLMSNGNGTEDQNAIFVQQLPNEVSPPRRGINHANTQSYPNHVRSSSLRRVSERSPVKVETEAKVRHRSPPPYFVHNNSSPNRVIADLPRNPVLDRLTGKTSSTSGHNPSRNDSYYRATNDTWNTSGAFVQSVIPSRNSNEMLESGNMGTNHPTVPAAVTLYNARGEMVLLEDDYVAPQKPPRRSRSSTPVDTLEQQQAGSAQKASNSRVSTPVSSVVTNANTGQAPGDVTYASQTSLEDLGGFSRDAFGRQSMSEKRHATLDAKSTDTYQRNKKIRDERQRQKVHDEAHAEQLARERNMQDQLARRGIKRPFCSSTEDDLAMRGQNTASQIESQNATSPTSNGITLGHQKGFQQQPVHAYQNRFSKYSVIGKRGDRLGLGDQLLQLLHQWGQSRQTPRADVIGLPRVNSADSLVDTGKHPAPHQQSSSATSKGKKSKGSSYKKDIGPSLGMKKSSSLESLQTMVQEIQIQEDVKSGYGPPRAGPPSVRVVRGRGCNESFRQAVDRSYEAPLGELANQMETLAEEETESCLSSAPYGRKPGDTGDYEGEGTYGKTKGTKKKQGIFRGLGSMFRFGRHRKSAGAASSAAAAAAVIARVQQQQAEEAAAAARLHEAEKLESRQEEARKQQDYIQSVRIGGSSNYQTAQAQGYPYFQRQAQQQLSGSMRVPVPQGSSGKSSRKSEGTSRVDKDINGNTNPNHVRSTSFDVYNEMTRPGSRVGIVDPKKYTHYINYEEIRHHLNDNKITAANANNIKNSNCNNKNGLSEAQLRQMRLTVVEQRKKAILESRRHQQHYHSQRREHPRERQERPVSNFYEYESIQAAMHAAAAAAAASQSQVSHPGNSSGSQLPQHHHKTQSHPHHQPQHYHQTNMSPPPSVPGLVLHGQPIYGMSSAQLQLQHQNRLNNNNGITLPSPSGPFTVGMHQTSPSQFQVISTPVNNSPSRQISSSTMERGSNAASVLHPSYSQYSQGLPQRPKPNSLPRRSHKADPMHPLIQSSVSTGPFPQHFPVLPQQYNGTSSSGRYSMHFPQSHQQSSYVQIPEQSASLAGVGAGAYHLSQPTNHRSIPHHPQQGLTASSSRIIPSSVQLPLPHHQVSNHPHAHHQHQHSTPSNVGSKV